MGWLRRVGSRLAASFINNSVIHLRVDPAPSTLELIGVMDRFLGDAPPNYPMEWDDFISWESSNAHVGEIRQRLGPLEFRLFSKNAADRKIYADAVVRERDKLAALPGISPRAGG